MIPRVVPIHRCPFAFAIRASSCTRFGIAAVDPARNGVAATAVRRATVRISHRGLTNARTMNNAPPTRSDAIIARLRSHRSATTPPIGLKNPAAPIVSRTVSDRITADPWVLRKTRSISAAYAAIDPPTEMKRATARRRIAAFGGVRIQVECDGPLRSAEPPAGQIEWVPRGLSSRNGPDRPQGVGDADTLGLGEGEVLPPVSPAASPFAALMAACAALISA